MALKEMLEEGLAKAICRARGLSYQFARNHYIANVMDQEDYFQECMVAWLKGDNMGWGMREAFSSLSPLSRKEWRKNKLKFFPIFIDINICRELFTTDGIEESILFQQVLEIIGRMRKGKIKRILLGYFVEGKSVPEMAEEMGYTQGRISQLKSEGLRMLRGMI